MNGIELQAVLLHKGITLEQVCNGVDISRNTLVGMLHGDREITKEVRTYVGTYDKQT